MNLIFKTSGVPIAKIQNSSLSMIYLLAMKLIKTEQSNKNLSADYKQKSLKQPPRDGFQPR